jgi:hypothetical protein
VVIGFDTNPYDSLPFDAGNFYRAKQHVPANTPITNTAYWQPLSTAIEVYVGGVRVDSGLYTVTAESPVEISFTTPPAAGLAVTILVRRGTWIDY